jgi:uncharacterized protein
MEQIALYYLDTYAMHEIISGNPSYDKYTTGISAITSRLNLVELYYALLSRYGEEEAEKNYSLFLPYTVDVGDDVIKEGMRFKLMHKERKFSYVDCISYTLAKTRNARFLTGDKEFKDIPQVDYIK